MENTLKKSKKKGFTLIELIIVLAVMAIIAAIAIPSYNTIKNNSAKKADTQTCETIERTALIVKADYENFKNGDYLITPTENGGTPTVTAVEGKNGDAATAAELQNAIDKVKKPQQTGANATYTLTVSDSDCDCTITK